MRSLASAPAVSLASSLNIFFTTDFHELINRNNINFIINATDNRDISKELELATLFDSITKPIKIFYVGDWDPSGLDIVRDLLCKIRRYQKTTNYPKLIRVGIHREDITAYNLPPCRIKEKDPRSEEFEKKYGPDTVESDALPPAELRQRIKDAVQELIDVPLWNRKLKVEEAEFRSIKEFAERFKSSQVSI